MLIRPEHENDPAAIRRIHTAAFANHPHSHQTEHLIVDALRAAHALSVSLVAEIEGEAIGHVAFSPAWIEDQDCDWYVLGPVGVLPEFQGRGAGSALVRAGLQVLHELRAEGCVVVGAPAFYCRLGFRRIPELILEGVPEENFLGLPMAERIPGGRIEHHDAFGIQA